MSWSKDTDTSLDTNLLSYWKLDESSGIRADAVTGTANDLTVTGDVTGGPGKLLLGATFGGGTDYVGKASPTGIAFASSANRSWSFWVNGTAESGARLMGMWSGSQKNFLFFQDDSGATGYLKIASGHGGTTDGTDVGTVAVCDGTWHHVVITFDTTDDKFRTYIDGVLDATSAAFSGMTGSTADFRIGDVDADNSTIGTIDEAAIWQKVLSAQEISDLYNDGAGSYYGETANAKTLVVAGGGGGGNSGASASGGGGAGELLESDDAVLKAGSYTVTVGAGGAGAPDASNPGVNGSDSVFGLITALGGGGGGSSNNTPGLAGGNGGGAGAEASADTGGVGTQFDGGDSFGSGTAALRAGGGGGGSASVGADGVSGDGGNGGTGTSNSITGSAVTYASGGGAGGGGGATPGTASAGGGANGSATNASAATANTGGGGGGGDADGGSAGGSGIVVVAYKTADFDSHGGGDDTGTDGDYTWVKFTSSGTFTLYQPIEWSVDDDTVALWHMNGAAASAAKQDNAEGTATYDLTEVNTPSSATGFNGEADGAYSLAKASSEYLTSASAASRTNLNAYTIMLWIKGPSQTNETHIISTDATGRTAGDFRIENSSGDFANFIIDTGATDNICTGTTNVFDDEWHHIAVTGDGTTARLYVDGVEEDNVASTVNLDTAGRVWYFGVRYLLANTNYFDGELDEIIVKNRAVSATEVSDYFQGTVTSRFDTNSNARRIYKNDSTSWSTTHDAATGQAADTTYQVRADKAAGGATLYMAARCFAHHDTSNLPDSGISIDSASWWGYVQSSANLSAFDLDIVESTATDSGALTTSDFDQFGTTRFADTIDGDTITNSTYLEVPLNATGIAFIDKTSYTNFVLMEKNDLDDSAPTETTSTNCRFDLPTDSNPSYLEVKYSAAAGPASIKSINGLASASIKSVNGVVIANVKSFNGLA